MGVRTAARRKVRGVSVKVLSKGGRVEFIRRQIQHIYPLEIHSKHTESRPVTADNPQAGDETRSTPISTRPRSVRKAAMQAKERIKSLMVDNDY